MEAHNAPRDLNFFGNITNDAMFAVTGWILGHLHSVDHIYKYRQYVIERIKLEESFDYHGRKNFKGGELLDEYPLKEHV